MTGQARNHFNKFLLLHLIGAIWLTCVNIAGTPQDNGAIVLNVTVTTEKGVVIQGLRPENFSITVDKQPQKLLSLRNGEVPASVGILIDKSGSQGVDGSKRSATIKQHLRQGLGRFFKLSHASNKYFAVAFNTKTEILQDWTLDHGSIVGKVDSLEFKGHTSMYDAISSAIPKVMAGPNSKHILILVSDGNDNESKVSFKEVRDLLKRSDVVLYCVGLVNADAEGSTLGLAGERVLQELSSISGGRALFMTNASGVAAFNEVFELIATELKTQYQLLIKIESSAGAKKWRKIKLKASQVDGSGQRDHFTARTREGYYQ